MDHTINTQAVVVVAICVVLWGLFSARLERMNVTAPIAFVLLGVTVANPPLSLIDFNLHSSTIQHFAEATLALVLFVDASRVNVRALRADVLVPVRLLGIGLPLTIAAGTAAAIAVFGGINFWVAALIGAIVAPTDAALAAPILHDQRVPEAVRRVLNVESGLNDGIVTPFVGLFLAAAVADETAHTAGVGQAALALVYGAAIGVGVGVVGAAALLITARRRWSAPVFRPLAVLGLAVLAYAASIEAGGNGFVAAFLGGMAFGTLTPPDDEPTVGFADEAGELLSLLVWFIFGAVLVPGLEHANWRDLVFAVLALTVVRLGPVALALLGAGLDRATVWFVGWFGPRGLASVIFGLIALDALATSDANRVLAVVTVTVALSVVLHGMTASPFAERYGARATRLHPARPEHAPATPLRTRSLGAGRRHQHWRHVTRGVAQDSW